MIPAIGAEQTIYSRWDDAKHSIVLVTHRPYWTWQELHDHEDHVLAPTLLAAEQPIALIVDLRAAPFFDPTATSEHVRKTGEVHRALPLEVVVFVLGDSSVGTLLKTLHERYGAPHAVYRIARTLDEARAMIAELRRQAQYAALVRGLGEFRSIEGSVEKLAGD